MEASRRVIPHKGTAHAIEVARRSGRRLAIAGIVQDEEYFRTEVEPHVDGDRVRYLGPVSATERVATLGGAHALLHVIDFDEPFGYSVVEAMACGTPVIAMARGSMAELVRHRSTGYLVSDLDAAVDAVDLVGDLDRGAIRSSAAKRFDVGRMVDQYVATYRTILDEGDPGGDAATPRIAEGGARLW